jgi:hypothetical protein
MRECIPARLMGGCVVQLRTMSWDRLPLTFWKAGCVCNRCPSARMGRQGQGSSAAGARSEAEEPRETAPLSAPGAKPLSSSHQGSSPAWAKTRDSATWRPSRRARSDARSKAHPIGRVGQDFPERAGTLFGRGYTGREGPCSSPCAITWCGSMGGTRHGALQRRTLAWGEKVSERGGTEAALHF